MQLWYNVREGMSHAKRNAHAVRACTLTDMGVFCLYNTSEFSSSKKIKSWQEGEEDGKRSPSILWKWKRKNDGGSRQLH